MANPSFPKINLLPQEVREARRFELWYPWIWSGVAILLVLIGIYFMILSFNQIALEQELSLTQSEIATTRAQSEALKEHEDLKIFAEGRELIVKEALSDRLDAHLIGIALTKDLPNNVSIERIKINEVTGLEINAVVEDVGDNPPEKDWHAVAEAVDKLESSSMFKNVWLNRGMLVDTYSNYEEHDKILPAKRQYNYPDVVDQFTISSDVKLTISPSSESSLWTDRLNDKGGN